MLCSPRSHFNFTLQFQLRGGKPAVSLSPLSHEADQRPYCHNPYAIADAPAPAPHPSGPAEQRAYCHTPGRMGTPETPEWRPLPSCTLRGAIFRSKPICVGAMVCVPKFLGNAVRRPDLLGGGPAPRWLGGTPPPPRGIEQNPVSDLPPNWPSLQPWPQPVHPAPMWRPVMGADVGDFPPRFLFLSMQLRGCTKLTGACVRAGICVCVCSRCVCVRVVRDSNVFCDQP